MKPSSHLNHEVACDYLFSAICYAIVAAVFEMNQVGLIVGAYLGIMMLVVAALFFARMSRILTPELVRSSYRNSQLRNHQ